MKEAASELVVAVLVVAGFLYLAGELAGRLGDVLADDNRPCSAESE